jgi:hypothetical protein
VTFASGRYRHDLPRLYARPVDARFIGGPRDEQVDHDWPDPPPPYHTAEGTHYELFSIIDGEQTAVAVYRVMPAGSRPPGTPDPASFVRGRREPKRGAVRVSRPRPVRARARG